jgi:hypothetical protein
MPSVQRLLAACVVLVVVWGLVFGLLDGNLWTFGNWAWACVQGLILFALVLALTRLQAGRRRSR